MLEMTSNLNILSVQPILHSGIMKLSSLPMGSYPQNSLHKVFLEANQISHWQSPRWDNSSFTIITKALVVIYNSRFRTYLHSAESLRHV